MTCSQVLVRCVTAEAVQALCRYATAALPAYFAHCAGISADQPQLNVVLVERWQSALRIRLGETAGSSGGNASRTAASTAA
jgi:hypothetical protein